MNETDREIYKALKIVVKRKAGRIDESVFTEGMVSTLTNLNYVRSTPNSTIITEKGLEELRKLESINHKNMTFYLSILSFIVSIIAILISLKF